MSNIWLSPILKHITPEEEQKQFLLRDPETSIMFHPSYHIVSPVKTIEQLHDIYIKKIQSKYHAPFDAKGNKVFLVHALLQKRGILTVEDTYAPLIWQECDLKTQQITFENRLYSINGQVKNTNASDLLHVTKIQKEGTLEHRIRNLHSKKFGVSNIRIQYDTIRNELAAVIGMNEIEKNKFCHILKESYHLTTQPKIMFVNVFGYDMLSENISGEEMHAIYSRIINMEQPVLPSLFKGKEL